jgi:hypothetical protein
LKSLKMEINMKEILKVMWDKDKEYLFGLIKLDTKANLRKMSDMDMVDSMIKKIMLLKKDGMLMINMFVKKLNLIKR